MTGMERSRIIPYASFCARIILGVIFVYAGAVKIMDPPGFAEAVSNYRILPDMLVNLTAVVLPWIEVLAGLCLVTGIWIEGGALLTGGLLAVFFIALTASLARGLDISCGCFSTSAEAQRITWTFLARDLMLMAMAAFVYFTGKTGPFFFSRPREQDRA
jgi:uncharacterized membrane protein YphA (DoxX/SURF4 family)